jgi:peptide/nickel transport system substrate-binding protein
MMLDIWPPCLIYTLRRRREYMNKKLALLFAVLMIVGMLMSGCTATPKSNATLRFGTASLDGVFNPILVSGVYDQYVVSMIFDGLIGNDPDGKLNTNYLASKYELSSDLKTYTFTLRDAKFSNGDAVTAQDVKFTIETIANPKYDGPLGANIANIVGYDDFNKGKTTDMAGVKVINDKTVSITITDPNVAEVINNLGFGILDHKYYAFTTWDDFKAKNAAPMGCGAFVFKDYKAGQALNVVVNPNYYGKKPNLAGVSILIIPDETQIQALMSGQVDIVNPAASKDNWDAMSAVATTAYAKRFVSNGYNVIGYDLSNPIFADKKVRQALAYGLDFKTFIQNQWQGFAVRCLCPISPVSWAYPDVSKLNAYDFNPTKANQLLDEAGWTQKDTDGIRMKDGKRLSFTWIAYTDSPWPKNLQALATEQWKAIGVEMKSELMDFNTVSDKVFTQGKFEMFNIGWSLSIDPDPIGMYDKASDVKGGYNAMHYFNARAEEIFKAARVETDQAKRAALYKEWGTIANDDLPYLFCACREEIWGISAKFQGFDKMGPYYNWVACLDQVTAK